MNQQIGVKWWGGVGVDIILGALHYMGCLVAPFLVCCKFHLGFSEVLCLLTHGFRLGGYWAKEAFTCCGFLLDVELTAV